MKGVFIRTIKERKVVCACGVAVSLRRDRQEISKGIDQAIRVDICSKCFSPPFFTGKQKLVDTEFWKGNGEVQEEIREEVAFDREGQGRRLSEPKASSAPFFIGRVKEKLSRGRTAGVLFLRGNEEYRRAGGDL
ncbi:MAG: hypothetical protein U0411_13155 [Thermodesulfovibrionales bacterium]